MRARVLGFIGFVIAGACGGKVIVDTPSGGGGVGGESGTTTSNVATTVGVTTGVTTAASTGSGPQDLCVQLCNVWTKQGCASNGCLSGCQKAFSEAGNCVGKLTVAIQCIVNSAGGAMGCTPSPVCTGALNEYESCITPGNCSGLSCSGGSDGSCGCKGVCDGVGLSAECGVEACTCFKDGTLVGKCQSSGPNPCDFFKGCCAAFFALGG